MVWQRHCEPVPQRQPLAVGNAVVGCLHQLALLVHCVGDGELQQHGLGQRNVDVIAHGLAVRLAHGDALLLDVAYAQRLSESGVRATLLSFERQIHGFMPMGRVIDEANEAVALCADALKRALKA